LQKTQLSAEAEIDFAGIQRKTNGKIKNGNTNLK
jgi:hypothetical protein